MNSTHDLLVGKIRDALMHAATHLEPELEERLVTMERQTRSLLQQIPLADERYAAYETSCEVLSMIRENLQIAHETHLPMCQDTGMVVAFVDYGPKTPYSLQELESALNEGITQAVKDGSFRNSVVQDPLFERKNTGTNLPPVIHWNPRKEEGTTIHFLLKGFGSENCSSLTMLNPTAQPSDVVNTVVARVAEAGGKPCPPIVVGVGLGGTAERAGLLAKRALCRPVGTSHPENRYAALERDIEAGIQTLNIGPGGFGGPLTALGVAIEYEPTHIAGLPVAVAISCWADRKARIDIGGGEYA